MNSGKGKRSTDIVNELSLDMNNLFDVVHESDLFEKKNVVTNVMKE